MFLYKIKQRGAKASLYQMEGIIKKSALTSATMQYSLNHQ